MAFFVDSAFRRFEEMQDVLLARDDVFTLRGRDFGDGAATG
jgi:hypothetical protein